VDPERPLLNQAFTYRRTLVVGPQKSARARDAATITAAEAVGPTVFGGWAKAGEVYDCQRDGGCPCGWTFEYESGEPKGIRQPVAADPADGDVAGAGRQRLPAAGGDDPPRARSSTLLKPARTSSASSATATTRTWTGSTR
jgi:hypothetical protein